MKQPPQNGADVKPLGTDRAPSGQRAPKVGIKVSMELGKVVQHAHVAFVEKSTRYKVRSISGGKHKNVIPPRIITSLFR